MPAPHIDPSESRPRPHWSPARKILAYVILFALAIASIWFINRRVDTVANLPDPSAHTR